MAGLHDYRALLNAEDLYVYDQCCANCHNPECPMEFPETAEEHYKKYGTLSDYDENLANEDREAVLERRREDAVVRDEEVEWCIYWKGRNNRSY